MKGLAGVSVLLAAFAGLSTGCWKSAAADVVGKWKNERIAMGFVLRQRGEDYSGELYLLVQDEGGFPGGMSLGGDTSGSEDQESMGVSSWDFPVAGLLSHGVYDRESNRVLFPVHNLRMVSFSSVRKLRESGRQYIEVEPRPEAQELVGEWRRGSNPPGKTQTFVRCRD